MKEDPSEFSYVVTPMHGWNQISLSGNLIKLHCERAVLVPIHGISFYSIEGKLKTFM